MKINIITEPPPPMGVHPWILRRAAEELLKIGSNVSILGEEGDINYFINYALYMPCNGLKIGHFTHLENSGEHKRKFIQSIPEFDFYTVTCNITRDILIRYGANPKRIFKIPYGSDERLKKPIVFGVVGRTYPSGRKGEYLVDKMVKNGYNVIAWGKGWPCKIDSNENNFDKLPDFYRKIDYLLVTSLNEGGPVPVIDAIQAGVPVIAPNVGWCWEFPGIRYEKGDWGSLKKILDKLTKPPTWEDWTKKHNELFKMCSNVSKQTKF